MQTKNTTKNQTLLNDLRNYLEYKESYLRSNSYKVYRLFGDNMKAFIELNELGDIKTNQIQPIHCELYKKYILSKYKHPTTRNKEIGQMKTFFYQFTKAGWERYRISPAQNVELLPKQDSELHEPFSEQQVADIIGKILEKGDHWLLLFVYFIHYSFSRPGREVRLLKVRDIKARTVMIRPENSKNRRLKTPTIAKPLETLIDKMGIRNYPLDWYVFGKGGEPGPVPCGQNMYYTRHKQILKELGITGNYTIYGWKHTGNIRAVTLGINDRELQNQNGFKEHRTLEIYLRRLSAYSSSEIYEKFV